MPDPALPSSGLSDWQLKLSYFFVANKLFLRKLLVVLLVIVNCAFWGYGIFGFTIWALDYQRLESQTKSMLFSSASVLPGIEAAKPQPLQLSNVEVFAGSDDLWDLLSGAFNPNADWLAEFDYGFTDDSTSTVFFPSFALPGQHKILMALAQRNSSPRLEIKNLTWRRITNFSELKESHELFTVTGDGFTAAKKAGNPSRLKFTLRNDSAYSYWQAGVAVLLYSSGNVAAINLITIPKFLSGSSRDLELNWTRPLPNIDSWEIVPEVNYLEVSNIMPPIQH